MNSYYVTFHYTEGARVLIEANTQAEAKQKVYDHMEWDGLKTLEQNKEYKTVHREYDVCDVERAGD